MINVSRFIEPVSKIVFAPLIHVYTTSLFVNPLAGGFRSFVNVRIIVFGAVIVEYPEIMSF